jgi:hypothetical protein
MNSLRRLTLSFLGLGLLMSLGTVSAAQTEGTPFIGTWSTATTTPRGDRWDSGPWGTGTGQ